MRYVLIALMGIVGAIVRAALEWIFPAVGFPVATYFINIAGCFALEITYNYIGRRMHLPKHLVSAMGVGFLGAFTTMSTFCSETVALASAGSYGIAAAYLAATAIGCFAAALAGHYVCRWLSARRMRKLLAQRALRKGEREAREQ